MGWTVARRADVKGLSEEVPYTILLVRLEEGVQLVTGSPGVAEGLRCGDPLEAYFDPIDDGLTLVRFRATDIAGAPPRGGA